MDYLTKLDTMLLYSLFMIFLSAAESFTVYLLTQASHTAPASLLDLVARFVFPISFTLVYLTITIAGIRQSKIHPAVTSQQAELTEHET